MTAQKPLDVLHNSLGSPVIVTIKGGIEYRGKMQGYDMHMNLVLQNADEVIDGKAVRRLGTVILRGDSVVSISP